MLTAVSTLRLYTDGSCYPSGTVAGWAWLLLSDDWVAWGSGAIPAPSNHQVAEVVAAIVGLGQVITSGVREVELLPDSDHVFGGLRSDGDKGWAHAATRRDWRSKDGKRLKNRGLWERLLELEGSLVVTCRRVPSHRPKYDTSDDALYNRKVDALALEARRVL
jgi:ribonuclease HI